MSNRCCLSVCLSVSNFAQNVPNGFTRNFQGRKVGNGSALSEQMIKLWWRSGSQIRIRIATLVRPALAEVCTLPVLQVVIIISFHASLIFDQLTPRARFDIIEDCHDDGSGFRHRLLRVGSSVVYPPILKIEQGHPRLICRKRKVIVPSPLRRGILNAVFKRAWNFPAAFAAAAAAAALIAGDCCGGRLQSKASTAAVRLLQHVQVYPSFTRANQTCILRDTATEVKKLKTICIGQKQL